MAEEGFKRKLTAILSADVVGYSRLMEDNEAATVHTLTSYREVISTLIKQHNGIVVDSPGDNLLADFVSVVDAVQCAVSVQNEINTRNEDLPENRKMQFRIGINLGDVIQEEERIYGDGVNIAARLEALADPGGICISKTAFDQIERKLPYGYEFIGDQAVKNISKPVGAYRVMLEPRVTVARDSEKEKPAPRRRKAILIGVTALLVIAVAVGIWQLYTRRPSVEPASVGKMAFPLPDKPSIAVLPFFNMSGDPEQEYFSDGLTEQIINGLCKVRDLFVIARNSSFAYKGKSVNVQQVGKELGVRYILEGSAQKAAERVRITAQLIDAITGYHLWSENYDRDLSDIFALQDEITLKIINALQVKLTMGEQARLWDEKGGTTSIQAFDKYMRGLDCFFRFTEKDNKQARQFFEEAINIDKSYALAYIMLGYTHVIDLFYGWSKSPEESFGHAEKNVEKALALNDSIDAAHSLLGWIYLLKRQHDEAIKAGERAIELNPNGAEAHAQLGVILVFSDKIESAIELLVRALRLNPIPQTYYFTNLAMAYRYNGQYEKAIEVAKKAISVNPDDPAPYGVLAASYSFLNRTEDARKAVEEILRMRPNFSLEYWANTVPFKNQEELDKVVNAFRKAGLPE